MRPDAPQGRNRTQLWGAAFATLALALFVVKMLQYGAHGWLDWFALAAFAASAGWSVLATRRRL